MADNERQIDWDTVLFSFVSLIVAAFIAIIITLPDTVRVPIACKFMQDELQGQEKFLSAYQNETFFEQAKQECHNTDTSCYDDILYGEISSTGSSKDIIVPMGTSFDTCAIIYDPGGLRILLKKDDDIKRALLDFIKKNSGKGVGDDVLKAYFDIMYKHESVHREQCLKDAKYYLTLKGHRESEIEAYQASIQEKKAYLEKNCKIYCPCPGKERSYPTPAECMHKCPSSLKCPGFQCTVPPVD